MYRKLHFKAAGCLHPRTAGTLLLSLLVLGACSGQGPGDNDSDISAQAAQIAAMQQQLAALRERAARVRSSNDIKRLQRSFGYYFDEGLWDEMTELFAEDAELEYGRDGVYRGKPRIREYFMALGGGQVGLRDGELNEHFQLMPVVTLSADGTTAKGRWRDIGLKGMYGEWAWWGEGPYENEYVLEDGVWKISRLHWFQTIMVPYEGGWGRNPDVNGGHWVGDELSPDAPMSIEYAPWPETFLPPFHFDNPVQTYVPAEAAQ